MNGHIIGFHPQTQKLQSPHKTPSNTLAVKGLRRGEKRARLVSLPIAPRALTSVYDENKGELQEKILPKRQKEAQWTVLKRKRLEVNRPF